MNNTDYLDSSIKSLWYVFFSTLFYMPLFFVFFINLFFIVCVSFLYVKIVENVEKISLKLGSILLNLYIASFLISALYLYILHCLGIDSYLIVVENRYWPLQHLQNHSIFILGIAYVFSMIYIAVTKLNKTELMNATFMVFMWLYWITLVNLVLNLPLMNFIDVPLI